MCDEVQNKYKERLEDAYAVLVKKLEEYNSFVDEPCQNCKSIGEEVEEYEDFLTEFMLEMGSYPPEDYPIISHKDVVKRALQRKKPFKADGKDGYRDYLLWKNILHILKTYKFGEIHFISENTSDFANPKDRYKLHEQLVDDIRSLGEDENRLVYWPTLKDFIDKVVKPHFESVKQREEFGDRLIKDKDNFSNPIESYLMKLLKEFDVHNYEVFVPGNNPSICEFHLMEAFNIEK